MSGLPITESWVARAARLHPERIAIDAPEGVLMYAQLDAGSAVLAERLADAAAAVPAGTTPPAVALRLPAGADFAIALHGCLRAGLVAVPIDGRLPAAEQARRAAGCEVELNDGALAAALAAATAALPAVRVSPEAALAGPPIPIAGSGIDAATPAVRLYTSGTTGPGTLVDLSRGALLWNAIGSAAALGQPPHERWLSAMPVAHVGGLSVLTRSAVGATTAVLRPSFDTAEQLALLQAGEATITSLVPTMLSRLLDGGLRHPRNLRLVLLGGAPISPELVDRAAAAGITVASTYGLSEAASQVLVNGHSLFCTTAALRGEPGAPAATTAPQDGEPSDAGEILVGGRTLATGAAGPGGWLATGDRGRRDPQTGAIAVVGRIAETIVTGGENVAPTEVEAALLALPQIGDAAVLGVPHPEWGEELQARVVLAPGAELDVASIRAALRTALPPFAVPKQITAVAVLPRTPTGKLVRRELT